MSTTEIKQALHAIGLALNASHNTVTTDRVEAQPDDYSWRIDNSTELAALDRLERLLLSSTDTCPLCNGRSNDPWTRRLKAHQKHSAAHDKNNKSDLA